MHEKRLLLAFLSSRSISIFSADQDSGRSRHGGGRRGRERARDEAQREQRADAYRTLRDDPDYRDMIDAYRRSRHPEDALAAARYAVEKKVPAGEF